MTIEEMFRSGKTLDEVIAEVGKIQTKVEKEKKEKEEREKKLAEKKERAKTAKEKLANAYIDYAETVANRKLTDKEKESLKKGFDFDLSIRFSEITPLDYINKVFSFLL